MHLFFFFNDPATTEIYTLSLHDALPISSWMKFTWCLAKFRFQSKSRGSRSEEHTSELQSRQYLVCRLLLEKKKRSRATRRGQTIGAVDVAAHSRHSAQVSRRRSACGRGG